MSALLAGWLGDEGLVELGGDVAHLGLVSLPLAGVDAVLQGRGDDGGHGVGPVGGHLVERAPGLGAVAVQPAGEAEHGGRRRADLVGAAAGEVGPDGHVGGGVLPAHVLPERVAGADRLQGHEHPRAVDVGEPVAVGVELLEPVQGPVPLGSGCAGRGRGSGRGSSWAIGSRSPTMRGGQGGSRLAAGWAAPVSTVAAAIRSAVAWVCSPVGPVLNSRQRSPSAHSRMWVVMPTVSSRLDRCWLASSALRRSSVMQTMAEAGTGPGVAAVGAAERVPDLLPIRRPSWAGRRG